MSTFAVKITQIVVHPHPDADSLEIAQAADYLSVVRKGQYQTGDRVAYIPENAIVPTWLLRHIDMWDDEKQKGRLSGSFGNKVIPRRLRGVVSQGLCVQLSPVPTTPSITDPQYADDQWILPLDNCDTCIVIDDQDVSELLGVSKWEPPVPVHLAGEVFNVGSSYTINFDVENIKAYPNVFIPGEEVIMTEKIHGCASFHTLLDTVEFGLITIGRVVDERLKVHVKSMDIQTHEIQFNEVLGWSSQPNIDNWYELETEDGTIMKLTGNHPVWLPDINAYRRVDELVGNESITMD
jgi:RNA ligase (TIGR02306 family)